MNIATKRLQDNFSRAAADYDAHAWLQRQQVERVLLTARTHLSPQAAVLDIGCGTGHFAEIAKLQHPGWNITGIDFSYAMARQAATRCDASLQGDATRLPLADDTVDAVVSSLCLQWVDDKARMLAEIRRVLKPQSIAIVTTLGDQTLVELQEATKRSGAKLGLLPMLSFDRYRALARESGMQLLACQRTRVTQHYPSVEALLESMRAIGAGNAGDKHFIAPKKFAQMIQQYEATFGNTRGIPATWEPILMLLKNI